MKTVLVEPLNIEDELLEELSKELGENGNIFQAFDTKPKDEKEWLERCKDCDQVILANSKMPDSLIEENHNLKYINIAFTGVDHVNVKKAKDKGIILSNASGYSNQAVCELVLGLSISLMRKLKDNDIRVRDEGSSEDLIGREVSGKVVGIVGLGNIGKKLARLFLFLGSRVIAYDRTVDEELEKEGVEYKDLDYLLKNSDIVTVHLPLNDSTRSFIGKDQFKLMKKDSIFINCARGPIVNNKELMEALNNGEIAGAAVDVYDYEPPLDKDYPLLKAKNLLMTGHIGYFTKEAMEKRARLVFENAINFINKKEINNRI